MYSRRAPEELAILLSRRAIAVEKENAVVSPLSPVSDGEMQGNMKALPVSFARGGMSCPPRSGSYR
jgi:hypothetical protein